MRRQPKGYGKLAEKFKTLLETHLGPGWKVPHVWPVVGYYVHQDVYRVEGIAVDPDGHRWCYGSWERLTDLVRHGIETSWDNFTLEVWLK